MCILALGGFLLFLLVKNPFICFKYRTYFVLKKIILSCVKHFQSRELKRNHSKLENRYFKKDLKNITKKKPLRSIFPKLGRISKINN